MHNARREVEALKIAPALVQARDVALDVPMMTSSERSLLKNPMRLFTDLYLSRGRRGVATLLDGISFTLLSGQRLGLIGENGAGKSTLLRLLAGIYLPSRGALEVNGVAKGLFDISLGMHSEASGLQNIYMRGLQMGMSLREIRAIAPEIVEFSELQDAIDKPIGIYSSGMRIRLAIAISTIIAPPDILLLDEWIGAADARFNAKVRARMMRLIEGSRGLVLATHNAVLMKSLCTHGLVIEKGRIAYFGPIADALQFYGKATLPTAGAQQRLEVN